MAQLYVENLKVRTFDEIEDLFIAGDTLTLTDDKIADNEYLKGLLAIHNNYIVELTIDRTIFETIPEFEVLKPDSDDEIAPYHADIYRY